MMKSVKSGERATFELVPEQHGWWFWRTNFVIYLYNAYGIGSKPVVVGRFKTLEEAIESFKEIRGEETL